MKRSVWILAIVIVLTVIAFVTLVEWTQPHEPASHQQEHMTMRVTDIPEVRT